MKKLISSKHEVESSNIAALTIIPELKVMITEFKNGSKYMYANVTPTVFDSLVSAESVGKEFNKVIKQGDFPYLLL